MSAILKDNCQLGRIRDLLRNLDEGLISQTRSERLWYITIGMGITIIWMLLCLFCLRCIYNPAKIAEADSSSIWRDTSRWLVHIFFSRKWAVCVNVRGDNTSCTWAGPSGGEGYTLQHPSVLVCSSHSSEWSLLPLIKSTQEVQLGALLYSNRDSYSARKTARNAPRGRWSKKDLSEKGLLIYNTV